MAEEEKTNPVNEVIGYIAMQNREDQERVLKAVVNTYTSVIIGLIQEHLKPKKEKKGD